MALSLVVSEMSQTKHRPSHPTGDNALLLQCIVPGGVGWVMLGFQGHGIFEVE